ncbi:MAG: hypothetical protein LBT68_03440 [Spirochaetales bacterium]|nr:hypothetical protein [Spirochaetales bacterium]
MMVLSKRISIILCAGILLLCAACREAPEVEPLPAGSFWASTNYTAGNKWYALEADLMAFGAYCEVYVAKDQQDRVSPEEAKSIADEFDTNIYGIITGTFGPASDVDENGKIVIFMLDIRDGYSGKGSESYVAGYFNPEHSLSGPGHPHSNQADMIYMDTYPGLTSFAYRNNFNITLAHEFQHLVNFNQTYIQGEGKQFDLWINEGLSSAAEYLYTKGHIDKKINYYKTEQPTGEIHRGVNFVNWTGNYSSYSTVYLFFQWLRIHAGNDIYKEIFKSPLMNYEAVVTAIRKLSQENQMGKDWAAILENWFIANAFCVSTNINGAKPHIYGYGGEIIGLQSQWSYDSGFNSSYLLAPGEGIYVRMAKKTDPLPSGMDTVVYKNIGLTLRSEGANICLIFNKDGVASDSGNGARVSAPLPSVAAYAQGAAPPAGAASKSFIPEFTEALPIDRVFRLPE